MSWLGSLLKRPPMPLIGLDISSSSIKLVELGQDKHGDWIVERFGLEPLQSGSVVDGNVENFDQVVEALKRLLKKSGTRVHHAVLALPQSAVITKRISLPGTLSEQELEVQVEAEASQYLPFPLEEVSLDFCVIGESTKRRGEIDLLFAATRKEKVQERSDIALLAGLTPVVIDVTSYASRLAASSWMSALPPAAGGDLVALIKLGSRNFSLQIVRNDEILYGLEQGMGGAQLTQLISNQYGISEAEAERRKCEDDMPAGCEEVVLRPFIANLAQDIARALQIFFSSTSYRSINHIGIYGGTACLRGVAQAIQDHTCVPVTVLNPFNGMKGPSSGRQAPSQGAPMYLTACGLAMRRYVS